jgi:Flp pilus assembly protein TadG
MRELSAFPSDSPGLLQFDKHHSHELRSYHMLSPKFRKFFHDKKAATAVAMAILFVPLLIAASAAVDFSRIASARTLLQSSVDSAAVAGAGAYQTSQLYTAAQDVAQSTYSGTGLQLPKFVSSTTPTIAAYCSTQGTPAQCGTGASASGTLSGKCPSGWDANKEYCVVVTASVTMTNSLFAWLIPSEVLSATAVATTAFPPDSINQGNFTHTSVGYGSDSSSIYAYAVPPDGNGGWAYGTLPKPNSDCAASSNGTISNENPTGALNGATSCNYLLIGSNSSSSSTGSLIFAANDPVAFTFVNFTGGTITSGTSDLDTTSYNSSTGASTINSGNGVTGFENELYVNGSAVSTSAVSSQTCTTTANDGSYCSTGYTVPATAAYTTVTTTTTCKTWNTSPNNTCKTQNTPTSVTTYSTTSSSGTTGCTLNHTSCTSSVSSTVSLYGSSSQTALYAACPAHNLYGSINAYPNATVGTNYVPVQDSINTYSSAYEVLGYPPTYPTNHALIPFLGPVNTQAITTYTVNSNGTSVSTSNLTYKVQAVCPQWPTTGTYIAATGTGSFIATGQTKADSETVNIYSTYYPNVTYSDGISTNIYPPNIAGCSPVTSATTTLPNASSTNPWWGWSPDNASTQDPGGANENPGGTAVDQCTSTVLNSAGNGITTTQNVLQSASYSNCTFLIQPLGTDIPTGSSGSADLVNYYSYIVKPGAFTAGTTGNPSNIIAMFPFFNEVTSGTAVTYIEQLPTGVSGADIPSGGNIATTVGNGTNGVATGYIKVIDSNIPTYLPTTVSITKNNADGTYTVTEPPSYSTAGYPPEDTSHQCYNPQANGYASGSIVPGDNNNSTPIDPVANPQLGVVLCDQNPPAAYGIYWNDMGSWANPPRYNDDLGYNNAATVFTCPTPSSTVDGGPSTLSD